MDYEESLEELEKTVCELIEENELVPVIVEGEKDVHALRLLGLRGEIIMMHAGKSLPTFCDEIAERHGRVILLTDWDRKGGQFMRLLKNNLSGRVVFDGDFRRRFASRASVKDVESLPAFIATLRDAVNMRVR
ncbi:MAG: topoisomerase [Thermoplasmata archaeon HGW-Thermoplasmata-1]|nr:MAG: topoisomerase [Thermoplasmata archaeon HGW-Thermoplasmata-1]